MELRRFFVEIYVLDTDLNFIRHFHLQLYLLANNIVTLKFNLCYSKLYHNL